MNEEAKRFWSKNKKTGVWHYMSGERSVCTLMKTAESPKFPAEAPEKIKREKEVVCRSCRQIIADFGYDAYELEEAPSLGLDLGEGLFLKVFPNVLDLSMWFMDFPPFTRGHVLLDAKEREPALTEATERAIELVQEMERKIECARLSLPLKKIPKPKDRSESLAERLSSYVRSPKKAKTIYVAVTETEARELIECLRVTA